MADFNDIPGGLRIPSQIPLNIKEWVKDEVTLSYLGVNNNLAFTYHDNIKIFCKQEKTLYVWREVQSGEENTGLVPTDFIYPDNIIVFGMDYSLKRYNFFPITIITTDNLADEIGTLPAGPAGTNGTNADMTRTSVTSNTIASSGSKTFDYTASTNLGWLVGTRLRFAYDVSNYMEGVITAVSSTSVTVTIDNSLGSGTYTAWNITIAGDKGTSGSSDIGIIIKEDTAFPLTITTQSTVGLDYILNFQLDRKKCFVTGTITNNTGFGGSNLDLLSFIDPDYNTVTAADYVILCTKSDGTAPSSALLLHDGNIILDQLADGETLYVNGFYFTN